MTEAEMARYKAYRRRARNGEILLYTSLAAIWVLTGALWWVIW